MRACDWHFESAQMPTRAVHGWQDEERRRALKERMGENRNTVVQIKTIRFKCVSPFLAPIFPITVSIDANISPSNLLTLSRFLTLACCWRPLRAFLKPLFWIISLSSAETSSSHSMNLVCSSICDRSTIRL
jgi:hypothetical protein